MDRSSRLLDELKIAEARIEPAETWSAERWSEGDRRARREVRRLRAEWEDEQTQRSVDSTTVDSIDEAEAGIR